MSNNPIKDKSFQFAIQIINLYKFLTLEKKEYIMSKQVLRSGTSIGANIEEAIGGHTKKDFLSKVTIAYKEARETNYWLQLLKETKYISDNQFNILFTSLEEILKIITAIQKTAKKNISN
ncbi:MAG TPA: four helix bundle protein [Candidatus Woesebacteria bacterium]|nr:four helix bundle protein [Candidatus Woesebacteria bacterium]